MDFDSDGKAYWSDFIVHCLHTAPQFFSHKLMWKTFKSLVNDSGCTLDILQNYYLTREDFKQILIRKGFLFKSTSQDLEKQLDLLGFAEEAFLSQPDGGADEDGKKKEELKTNTYTTDFSIQPRLEYVEESKPG